MFSIISNVFEFFFLWLFPINIFTKLYSLIKEKLWIPPTSIVCAGGTELHKYLIIISLSVYKIFQIKPLIFNNNYIT